MKSLFRYLLLALAVGGRATSTCLALQTTEAAEDSESPSQEELAIKEIMASERWTQAMQQFDQWVSLQSVYNDDEIEALRSELRNRVAVMSPTQLEDFLTEMEARLAILLSPAATEARQWMAPLTDQAVQRMRAKYGVEDPIRVPATDLENALRQFAADRQAQAAGAAAFNQSRQSAASAAIRSNESQQQALNQAAQRGAGSFQSQASPYAPRSTQKNPRTFSSPYPKMNYSIGPWGGVWITPRQ
jgi:hypothetical protein